MLIMMALTGCKDPTGIWLFQLETSGFECVDTITENYNDGSVPGGTTGTSEWTLEYTETVSPALMFGQIAQHSRTEGVLIFGGEVYPGTLADGTWTFSWTGEESSQSSETHQDGYRFGYDVVGTGTTTFSLDISGDDAVGEISGETDATQTWTESDEWDRNENGVFSSQIPSTTYLVDGDGFGVTNSDVESDCSAADCELSVQSLCSGATPFTATWSGFLEEDAYEGVAGANQEYGI